MKVIWCALLLAMVCVAQDEDPEGNKKWYLIYIPTGDYTAEGDARPWPLGIGSSSTPEDMKFNIDIYDKFINRNRKDIFENKAMFDTIPLFQKTVHYDTEGFECNEKLCGHFGVGTVISLGICSQYYCNCTLLGPEDRQCTGYYAYDPVYKMCDVPTKIRICI